MRKMNFIPKESLGEFILGKNIKEYIQIPHKITHHKGKNDSYDSYIFDELGITLWLDDNNNIETIRCTKACYWEGKNLIKMPIDDFLLEYNVHPQRTESLYVFISENRSQKQEVYDFDDLGLIIWTWRKKIKTILISDDASLEE